MARSFRKIAVIGNCTGSEKEDKRRANRLLRLKTRQVVTTGAEIFPLIREVSNVWYFAKDGKSYCPWISLRK